MKNQLMKMELTMLNGKENLKNRLLRKRSGIDGVIVTIGLCIIALLICVVMKDELSTFVSTIVGQLTNKATTILGS